MAYKSKRKGKSGSGRGRRKKSTKKAARPKRSAGPSPATVRKFAMHKYGGTGDSDAQAEEE